MVTPLGEAPHGFETETQTETLNEAFKDARDAFYALPFEPEFEGMCQERNIPIDATNSPRYWAAASDFARRAATAQGEAGVPRGEVVIKELYAATPDYIYSQAYLDRNRNDAAKQNGVSAAKRVISYYNGLIRETAEQWPDVRAPELQTNLLNIANVSVEHPALKQSAGRTLSTTVRGAQHEVAFGQILEYTGRTYRDSEIGEDLRGIDFVVDRPRGGVDYIDVKASMHDVAKRRGGDTQPFARDHGNKLTIYSMLTDTELDGYFYVTADVATDRAKIVNDILDGNNPTFIARQPA